MGAVDGFGDREGPIYDRYAMEVDPASLYMNCLRDEVDQEIGVGAGSQLDFFLEDTCGFL